MTLANIPTDKLEQELIKREAAKLAATRLVNHRNKAFVLEHINALLDFAPEHSYTSCSDENPCNGYSRNGRPRCNRCALLSVQAERCNADLILSIELLYDEYVPEPHTVIVQ